MTHPTNDQRAACAQMALNTFRTQVGEDDDATLILDLTTDLGHLACMRRIDFVALVAKAVSVWAYERKHPDGLGASPQVAITVAGRRPTYAWRRKERAA